MDLKTRHYSRGQPLTILTRAHARGIQPSMPTEGLVREVPLVTVDL
jgi:hypothetical protein